MAFVCHASIVDPDTAGGRDGDASALVPSVSAVADEVSPPGTPPRTPPRSQGGEAPRSQGSDQRGRRVHSPSLRCAQPARPTNAAERGSSSVPVALAVMLPNDRHALAPEWRCVLARNERERREYAKISEASTPLERADLRTPCDGIGDDDQDNSLPAGAFDTTPLVMADLRFDFEDEEDRSDENDCFCGALFDFDAICWSEGMHI
jgi:hypothetical protein